MLEQYRIERGELTRRMNTNRSIESERLIKNLHDVNKVIVRQCCQGSFCKYVVMFIILDPPCVSCNMQQNLPLGMLNPGR